MNGPVNAKCYSPGLSSLVNDLVNVNNLRNGLWNSYVTRLFKDSMIFSLIHEPLNGVGNDLLNSNSLGHSPWIFATAIQRLVNDLLNRPFKGSRDLWNGLVNIWNDPLNSL